MTPADKADAITNPRVGDVWQSKRIRRQVQVIGVNAWVLVWNERRGLKTLQRSAWNKWAATATLIERGSDA